MDYDAYIKAHAGRSILMRIVDRQVWGEVWDRHSAFLARAFDELEEDIKGTKAAELGEAE